MLTLVERAVDLDRFFGGRHAFFGASVRKGAAGDGEIGEKARLKAEIADTARDLEASPADLDRPGRIDGRVEHAEIGVAAAGRPGSPAASATSTLRSTSRTASLCARVAQAQRPWY